MMQIQKNNFYLRPLWVKAGQAVSFGDGRSLGMPGYFTHEDFNNPKSSKTVGLFCERVLDLGYNAVIFGCWNDQELTEQKGCLSEFFSFLRGQGLGVIIKPTVVLGDDITCLYDKRFRQCLRKGIQETVDACGGEVDFLFWESICQNPCYHQSLAAREKLAAEVVCEEMQLIEKIVDVPLVFYLSADDEEGCQWLFELCDRAAAKTTIAFPARNNGSLHSYWTALHRRSFNSATPLLPVVNAGHVGEGGGLWPMISLDLFEQVRCRMEGYPFCGAIALTETLPNEGGFLDCGLWVFGQMLQQQRSPDLLAERWFAAHKPNDNYLSMYSILMQAGHLGAIAAKMRTFVKTGKKSVESSECLRVQAESVFAQVQNLQNLNLPDGFFLSDYLTYFVRDVRCIVLAFLHHHHVPFPQTFNKEDLEPAFWTEVARGSVSGVSSIPTITCLDQPFQGEEGSPMQQIAKENGVYYG